MKVELEEMIKRQMPRDNYVMVEGEEPAKSLAKKITKKKIERLQTIDKDPSKQDIPADDPSGAINVEGVAAPKVLYTTPKKSNISQAIEERKSTVAPPAPAVAPGPPAVSEEVREGIQEESPRTQSGVSNMLVALAPLITGALTGNMLEGTAVASDYLVTDEMDKTKRMRDLAGKIEEAKRAPRNAGGNRYLQLKYEDDDGISKIGVFDRATGLRVMNPQDPTAAYAGVDTRAKSEFSRRLNERDVYRRDYADFAGQGAKLNPTTGLVEVIRNGKFTPVENQEIGTFHPKHEKDMKEVNDEFMKSFVYKDASPVLSRSASVSKLLNTGSYSAINAAKAQLAKMSGEVGALSDQDIERYGGPPDYRSRIERYINLQDSKKPLLPEEIEELKVIAKIYREYALDRMTSGINSYAAGAELDKGIPRALALQSLKRHINPLLGGVSEARKDEKGGITPIYSGNTVTFGGTEYEVKPGFTPFYKTGSNNVFMIPKGKEEEARKNKAIEIKKGQ